jgi:glycosyltransferase involved in cell wall biosynthesis
MSMQIYADLRCLQDESYAFRGVGYHASVLLKNGRQYFRAGTQFVGLIDPAMPALPAEYAALVDRTDEVFAPTRLADPSVYVQLSPMTHDPVKSARFLNQPNILSCAVVYDFIPLDVSERYLTNSTAINSYSTQLGWLAAFNRFFPISQYAGRRLQEVLGIHRTAIDVTGVALRPIFEQTLAGDEKALEAMPDVRNPYVMFVGGGDPRKNVEVLVIAHSQLRKSHPKLQLIIAGNYPPPYVAALQDLYEKHGGDVRRMHFHHGISDGQLVWLYRHAVCTVCSSKIEGFSLPIIEAAACDSPLLASDNEAHRELLGADVPLFEPTDSATLVALLQRAASDSAFRTELQIKRRPLPHRFTAEAVSNRFWLPIAAEMRKRQTHHQRSRRASQTARPRIAILSPFPPDQSGVADYTRCSIQALGKIADVDVFTEVQNPLPTPEVRRFRPVSNWPYVSGEYDGVMTVIGNSHFHIKMIELQRAHGGACLIHDNRLAELYNWWKGPEYFQEMACRSLGRHVPIEESQSWMAQPGKLPSIFFDELIPHARPLIVHSRGIQKQCRIQYGIEAQYLPFCCYRDFPERDLTPTARANARATLGVPADQVMLVSLGIVGPTKAPHDCIEAVAQMQRAGINAHLYFVGSSGGMEEMLQAHAAQLGAAGAIHFTGDWVSTEDYYRYVLAADFAIQLRNHFFGGLSGAMLDCIGSGLVTVANDDLAEALDSPATVLRIPDDLSADAVSAQLIEAYRQGMHHDRLLPCRADYLREHSFDRYARELLQVLGLEAAPSARLQVA